jgi:hypothetical protein
MDPLVSLTLISLLAFLAEGLTEYLARPVLAFLGVKDKSPMWLRYVAAIVGVGLAFAYQADLLALVGFQAVHPAIGLTLTGILIGRGSNYVHDLMDRYFAPSRKPLKWL